MKKEEDPGKAKPRSTGICQSFRMSDSFGRKGWLEWKKRKNLFSWFAGKRRGYRTSISSIWRGCAIRNLVCLFVCIYCMVMLVVVVQQQKTVLRWVIQTGILPVMCEIIPVHKKRLFQTPFLWVWLRRCFILSSLSPPPIINQAALFALLYICTLLLCGSIESIHFGGWLDWWWLIRPDCSTDWMTYVSYS